MSHFTVMVIGEDPEGQLEPFDESIDVEEYSNGVVKQSEINRFMDYYEKDGKNPMNKPFAELYEELGEKWNGNTWKINPETGLLEDFSTYNPKSKWDSYQLGGRWYGFFKLKKGGNGEVGKPGLMTPEAEDDHCDQALKGQIDFEGMKDDAGKEAVEHYNKVKEAFGGVIPKIEHSWSTIIDPENPFFSAMSIDEKRAFYQQQDSIKTVTELQTQDKLDWFFDLDDYQFTVEEYEQKARNNAVSTFAVVKDGEWFEKGKMGWWAIVSDEKDTWNEEFSKLIDSVSDDTLISLYDCHI